MPPCIREGGVQSVDAAADGHFKVTQITLNRGVAYFEGYFYNNGDTGCYVKEVIFRNVQTTDRNRNYIWRATEVHCNTVDGVPMNIYVPAGGRKQYYTFTWRSDNIPQYGDVDFNVYTTIRY